MKTLARKMFVGCAAAVLLAGCATPTTSWDTTDNPKGKSVLDGYGKGGWELVSYTSRPKDATGTNFVYQYVFKRPKK